MPTLNWNDDVFFSIQIHPVYQFHVCSNIFLMDAAPVVFRVKKSASFTNLLKTDETSISFFIILLCLCLLVSSRNNPTSPTQTLNVWSLYLHLPYKISTKCRSVYHTSSVWTSVFSTHHTITHTNTLSHWPNDSSIGCEVPEMAFPGSSQKRQWQPHRVWLSHTIHGTNGIFPYIYHKN